MKTVETIRGGQEYPLILDNGDKYDSVSILHDDSSGKILYVDPLVNTDFTENYHEWMSFFQKNEIVRYVLERNPRWVMPEA